MISYQLFALLVFLSWGCGEEKATDSQSNKEEKKVVADDPASSTTPKESSAAESVASPSQDNEPVPEGCSSGGRLCLIVSLDRDQGLQVKAVIKEEGKVASNAQGNVIFSFVSIYAGEIEGFFDAEGQYHDLPEDTSGSQITIAVSNGEAILYDNEIDSSDFDVEVSESFVLKARYNNTTAELKSCQIAETIDC